MIRFACPGCSARFSVDSVQTGQLATCPECEARFVLPAVDGPPDPPSAPPAPSIPPVSARPATTPVTCPSCEMQSCVNDQDLGHFVECPACTREFLADQEPRPRAPRARRRLAQARHPRRKPGSVTVLGALLLAGGLYAAVHSFGALVGSASFFCGCLFWPPWYMMAIWSVFAILRGVQYLGENADSAEPPYTLHVIQILGILNLDLVNFVLGIVGASFAKGRAVREYFPDRLPD